MTEIRTTAIEARRLIAELEAVAAKFVPPDGWRAATHGIEVIGRLLDEGEYWTARARFRTWARATRYIEAHGATPEKAAEALRAKLSKPFERWA